MHCINQWHPGPSVCGGINPSQAVDWWPDKTTLRILNSAVMLLFRLAWQSYFVAKGYKYTLFNEL